MSLLEIMLQRRSIRKYTGEDISAEKLEKILQAGLLAPTSRNRKPCTLYVVKDRAKLEALSQAKNTGAAMLADSAAAIAVFGDPLKADTWIEDSSIALSYMNLMAVEQGVGSCWVQMHLREDREGQDAEQNVLEILGAPAHFRIVGILALGMPAERPEPHTLPDTGKETIQI